MNILLSTFAAFRLIHLPRPVQPVRQRLAHAGAERVFQGFPGVLQRFAHGVDRVEPVRERGGAGRGERAAGAVIARVPRRMG